MEIRSSRTLVPTVLFLSLVPFFTIGCESSGDGKMTIQDAETAFAEATTDDDYISLSKDLDTLIAAGGDPQEVFDAKFLKLRCQAIATDADPVVALNKLTSENEDLMTAKKYQLYCNDLASANKAMKGVTILEEATNRYPDYKAQFETLAKKLAESGGDAAAQALKNIGYMK